MTPQQAFEGVVFGVKMMVDSGKLPDHIRAQLHEITRGSVKVTDAQLETIADLATDSEDFPTPYNETAFEIMLQALCDLRDRYEGLGKYAGPQSMTILEKHIRYSVTVANGAGRFVCSCGWQSRVSDDGHMFDDGWYSPDQARDDFRRHYLEVTGSEYPESDLERERQLVEALAPFAEYADVLTHLFGMHEGQIFMCTPAGKEMVMAVAHFVRAARVIGNLK